MKFPNRFYREAAMWLSRLGFLPPLLARATLATSFIVSGRRKFSDLKGDTEFFRGLKIPVPGAMVPFVASTEVACGTLIGLGAATRLAALPLIPVMVVAILTARRKEFHSFSDLTGIFEFSYILLLGYLATQGAGPISLDSLIKYLSKEPLLEEKTGSEFQRLKAA